MRITAAGRAVSAASHRRRRRSRVPAEALFVLPAVLYLAALAFYPFFELVRMSVSQVTLLDKRGMVDSLLGLVHVAPVYWLVDGRLPLVSVALVNAWVAVPFATLVYRAALLDIPSDVLASADVDGARPWQVLRYIVLPLLRPCTLVLAVVSLVYAFKSFDFIYIMTFGGPGTASTTLPFLSYRLAFEIYRYSQGAAVAVVTVAVVVLLAVLYIRQVRREERA